MILENSNQLLIELQTIMLKNKIKKNVLADRLNITQSALTSRFNQENISIDMLLEMCNALNLDIDINFINKGDIK